ncbi:MAG TPA: DNA mismatch repair endonuclease MutL [Anaerolineae bacterium]|nr:DNA mismatch repair endonuclease MutL [Anaerolineae bacterium]
MSINILSEQLASQIAAGEVVERPYSVVKELLENAIDAGAGAINIDIREGGRKSIQIADDGCGIPADEIETAFLRHATSKLQTVDDLAAIRTLGFRGEALAAIASVSQVTVISRAQGDSSGTRLTLEAGVKSGRETVGAPQGTVIAVENLFYNTPARLKFLKSSRTEKRLIDELVTRYALAYPHIRLRLTHNGRITFQSNGSGHVLDVLVEIYGPEIARQLLEIRDGQTRPEPVEGSEGESPTTDHRSPITVSGFIGPPSVHFARRDQIVLFVNGRWVKDSRLTYAVIQAYHTLLPQNRYPLGILFLELPPEDVDVNVHPTKTEVRFRGDKAPFGLVQRAVRETLVQDAPLGQAGAWAPGSQMETGSPGWGGKPDFAAPPPQEELGLAWPDTTRPDTAVSPKSDSDAETAVTPESQLPIMRLVGQVGGRYIITEGPDGLFLIDQHAAHCRVLYEQLQAQLAAGEAERRVLAEGTAVSLTADQSILLDKYQPQLRKLGFTLEPFGPNTVMTRAVPAAAAGCDAARLVTAVMLALERGRRLSPDELAESLLRAVGDTAAVAPDRALASDEMERLIHHLEQCRDPFTDPAGKPTFIYLSVAQLAREFGQI